MGTLILCQCQKFEEVEVKWTNVGNQWDNKVQPQNLVWVYSNFMSLLSKSSSFYIIFNANHVSSNKEIGIII